MGSNGVEGSDSVQRDMADRGMASAPAEVGVLRGASKLTLRSRLWPISAMVTFLRLLIFLMGTGGPLNQAFDFGGAEVATAMGRDTGSLVGTGGVCALRVAEPAGDNLRFGVGAATISLGGSTRTGVCEKRLAKAGSPPDRDLSMTSASTLTEGIRRSLWPALLETEKELFSEIGLRSLVQEDLSSVSGRSRGFLSLFPCQIRYSTCRDGTRTEGKSSNRHIGNGLP